MVYKQNNYFNIKVLNIFENAVKNVSLKVKVYTGKKSKTYTVKTNKNGIAKIKLTDKVMISENASGMGGSQVFLEAGTEMTVDELIKAICIASGNDMVATKKKSWSIGEKVIIKQPIGIIF